MDEVVVFQKLMSPKKAIRFFELGTNNPSPELILAIENQHLGFEEKIDGTRATVNKKGDSVKIYGRGTTQAGEDREQSDYTNKFPELVVEFKKIDIDFILDGEIVVYDKNGKSDFGAVQGRTTRTDRINSFALSKPATYLAFDILSSNKTDLIKDKMSFGARDAFLKALFAYNMKEVDSERIKHLVYVSTTEEKIKLVESIIEQEHIEGLMIKDIREPYIFGASDAWCKAKKTYTEDVFVVGCSSGTGRRYHNGWFGGLHCYQMLNGTPVHVTTVGGGFSDKQLIEFSKRVSWKFNKPLSGYKAKEALAKSLEENSNSVFVIEIEHYGWMKNSIRHPNFIREREDKSPEDCKRELPIEGTLDAFW